MQFHCTNCNLRMKFQEATATDAGTMSVTSICPLCLNRTTLLANPGETTLLRALNAWSGGPALMTELLEMAHATLAREPEEAMAPPEEVGQRHESPAWTEIADEFVWIEPGTFMMGSPESEPGRETDEGPLHEVTISRGFFLGKYPLTRGQWQSVMGTTPWFGRCNAPSKPDHPAVYISWRDVQAFIGRLNEAAGAERYRLPTEAEWEYACRAGTTTAWSFGDDRSRILAYARYLDSDGTAEAQVAPAVGTRLPNPWGLHDMHGNVWEWCQDRYSGSAYATSPAVDPTGPEGSADYGSPSARVIRGGYYRYFTRHSRSAARNARLPDHRHRGIGARLVMTATFDFVTSLPGKHAGKHLGKR